MVDIHVYSWMIHELGLTGCELLAYAAIYQAQHSILLTEEERARATFAQTLTETVGYSERNVRMSLANLFDQELIVKRTTVAGGRRRTYYQTTLPSQGGK